uniref:(northern house mosquito) hypothetical protein n=2 Tax=Culex pipiens TaxID=7175 RepID=A0A8D8E8B7_CULPI
MPCSRYSKNRMAILAQSQRRLLRSCLPSSWTTPALVRLATRSCSSSACRFRTPVGFCFLMVLVPLQSLAGLLIPGIFQPALSVAGLGLSSRTLLRCPLTTPTSGRIFAQNTERNITLNCTQSVLLRGFRRGFSLGIHSPKIFR